MQFKWPSEKLTSETTRKALRQSILEQIFSAESGHPGGSLSMVEILAAIFDGNFHQNPKDQQNPERDRFVLSKGHGVPALYSILSYLGYFSAEELVNLRRLGHFLQGHPDKDKYPLMEASTGSLGQGVSVALGLALGLRLDYQNKKISRLPKVYCVIGDGEFQEGQVWECLMAAGKFKPGNLIFILDNNKGQIDGPVKEVMNLDPLEDKVKAFNWKVTTLDGHNVNHLHDYFSKLEVRPEGNPHFLIADTVKGKGISFMEHPTKWHGAAPKRDELLLALNELFGSASNRPYGSLIQ